MPTQTEKEICIDQGCTEITYKAGLCKTHFNKYCKIITDRKNMLYRSSNVDLVLALLDFKNMQPISMKRRIRRYKFLGKWHLLRDLQRRDSSG